MIGTPIPVWIHLPRVQFIVSKTHLSCKEPIKWKNRRKLNLNFRMNWFLKYWYQVNIFTWALNGFSQPNSYVTVCRVHIQTDYSTRFQIVNTYCASINIYSNSRIICKCTYAAAYQMSRNRNYWLLIWGN